MIIIAVAKIEEYSITGVAKVILKPTKAFPNGGWFYCDIEHLDLVERYTWFLAYQGKNRICVEARKNPYENILFHQTLTEKILGYNPDCIDHVNLLEIDNTDCNMNLVDAQKNRRNTPSQGYYYNFYGFRPKIRCDCRSFYDTTYKSEAEAALATYYLRQQYYSDYDYAFLKDRRNDLDIIDLQYTGKISEEEATFRHVMRYARDNAWYVYRYNLFNYFKQYHIPVPEFRLDEQGFMVHPITGQKLCPL